MHGREPQGLCHSVGDNKPVWCRSNALAEDTDDLCVHPAESTPSTITCMVTSSNPNAKPTNKAAHRCHRLALEAGLLSVNHPKVLVSVRQSQYSEYCVYM